ncbi:MAG TPA: hypothetical protein VH596_18580 [Terriglobales bacterium]|jgi:hypothetical protein
MKRLFVGTLGVVVFFLASSLGAAAQKTQSDAASLGDFARTVRKNKPRETGTTPKVYDNDNIGSATPVSIVGQSNSAPDSANNSAESGAKAEGDAATDSKQQTSDAPKVTPGESQGDRQRVYESWKQRIDDQKKKIDQLSNEINDLKNVNNSQVSVWPDQKYAQTLTDKQKSLDDAKTGLTDLQEQARKAGVPSSFTE